MKNKIIFLGFIATSVILVGCHRPHNGYSGYDGYGKARTAELCAVGHFRSHQCNTIQAQPPYGEKGRWCWEIEKTSEYCRRQVHEIRFILIKREFGTRTAMGAVGASSENNGLNAAQKLRAAHSMGAFGRPKF